jgi:4-hydroxythreonine-4-phosphate dehydrogenase
MSDLPSSPQGKKSSWIAITMGDAAGIGPEIIAKAFAQEPALMRNCFVAGDLAVMQRACELTDKEKSSSWTAARISQPKEVLTRNEKVIPVLQVGESLKPVSWGRVSPLAGEFAGRCVTWAAQAALRGEIAALVTAPINKEALAAAGEPYQQYPGHTELLQALAAQHLNRPIAELPVRMMLANDELRTVLVSIHLSLREALAAVTYDSVLQTIQITHQALSRMLGRQPRIAVAGLNPHAGEGGMFGREEIDVIAPAIQTAQSQGCDVSGPWAPDTVFMRARAATGKSAEFDVVIAMYHDQGLIPVKYLGVEHGVNVTLGLPLVRTSPDHGTAFDIAGQGLADAASLLAAVRMAVKLA